MSIKRDLLVAGIVVIGCGVISSSYAETATSTFAVQATVVGACTITTNILDFGSYDAINSTNLDQTTTLDVTCTTGTAYTVALDEGIDAGATVASRKMTDGVNTLDYSLYQDSARAVVWGETVGTDTVAGTGTGIPQTLTVYGRVFSGQTTVPAGTYTDTITATVEY